MAKAMQAGKRISVQFSNLTGISFNEAVPLAEKHLGTPLIPNVLPGKALTAFRFGGESNPSHFGDAVIVPLSGIVFSNNDHLPASREKVLEDMRSNPAYRKALADLNHWQDGLIPDDEVVLEELVAIKTRKRSQFSQLVAATTGVVLANAFIGAAFEQGLNKALAFKCPVTVALDMLEPSQFLNTAMGILYQAESFFCQYC